MSKAKTPSFKTTFQLRVTRKQTRELERSFEAARQLDNYLKGYALKRVRLIRESKDWQAARKLPQGEPKSKERVARAQAFQAVKTQYGLEQISLERKARAFGVDKYDQDNWIGACFPAHVEQKIALRVLGAAERMLYGQSRRLRFKTKGRGVKSLENKSDKSGIRFREVDGKWGVYYQAMFFPVLFNKQDQCHQHALEHKVKYSQIIRKTRKGKVRYEVQLVQEGDPCPRRYQKNGSHNDFRTDQKVKHKAGELKHPVGKGKVSIDIGPSKYALVGVESQYAKIGLFCVGLETNEAKLRLKKRQLDRQRRANNPDNYHANFKDKHGNWKKGTVRKGSKKWIVSTRQRKVQEELNEVERKLAATREKLQFTLKNQIIQLGTDFCFEKVSIKAWQKMWGKSIGNRAPGVLMGSLKQLAERAEFNVNEYSTKSTYLSQRCECGSKVKKPLSQRTHDCESCGRVMDRDLYSAFLGTAVDKNSEYHAKNLEDFSSWEAILHAAWSLAYAQGIPATVKPTGFSDLVPQGQSGSHVKHEQNYFKVQDVVGCQSGAREPVRDNVPACENPLNLFMGSFTIL
jgi:transposase